MKVQWTWWPNASGKSGSCTKSGEQSRGDLGPEDFPPPPPLVRDDADRRCLMADHYSGVCDCNGADRADAVVGQQLVRDWAEVFLDRHSDGHYEGEGTLLLGHLSITLRFYGGIRSATFQVSWR